MEVHGDLDGAAEGPRSSVVEVQVLEERVFMAYKSDEKDSYCCLCA